MNNSTEQPVLPELQDTVLDPGTVEQLFRDLAACTEIIEIITKQSRREMVGDQAFDPSLEQARELLLTGQVCGLQIRYRYQDADWFDTLMPTPQGIRIVRIRHEIH